MKKLMMTILLTLGLGSAMLYATQAAIELEHATKSAVGDDGYADDMSKMKAAGKCAADQSPKKNVKKRPQKAKTKAELELEHANKLADSADSVAGDMGNMKAQGKCGSN